MTSDLSARQPKLHLAATGQPDFDPRPYIDGIGALLAGTANVIMQLGLPGVGHGVIESKVESGQVTKHPLKRFRTTFTYLSVALLGNDHDRQLYREAVNTSHRLVHSDANSPVKYNAFSPDLQLWVAACLYWGSVDLVEKLHGPQDEQQADDFYRHAARFGTTLQVPPEMWPADRAAFEQYWTKSLERIQIDDTVRAYLTGLMKLEHLPRVIQRTRARSSTFVTTGFLPPMFREQMRLTWTEHDDERFTRYMRRVGAISARLPGPIRRFPINFFLWDVRRRVRAGTPLV